MSEEEIDQIEADAAKLKETIPDTPEEEKTLQVPNRQKDPKFINMPSAAGWLRLKVRSSSNVRDVLNGIANEIRNSSLLTGEVAHEFLKRIIDLVGDVPVRFVSKADLYAYAARSRELKPIGYTRHSAGWALQLSNPPDRYKRSTRKS